MPNAERGRPAVSPARRSLLDELVGREIASRLRARYAELAHGSSRAGADQPR